VEDVGGLVPDEIEKFIGQSVITGYHKMATDPFFLSFQNGLDQVKRKWFELFQCGSSYLQFWARITSC